MIRLTERFYLSRRTTHPKVRLYLTTYHKRPVHCTGVNALSAGIYTLLIVLLVASICVVLLSPMTWHALPFDLSFATIVALATFPLALRHGRSMLRPHDILLYWAGFAVMPLFTATLAVAIGFYAFVGPTAVAFAVLCSLLLVSGAAFSYTWTLTPPPNACHNCGYDLLGAPTNTCPECGAKTPATPK